MSLLAALRDFPIATWTMPLALIAVILLAVRSLIRRDKDPRSFFSFEGLLLDPQTMQPDPARAIMLGSWGILSWGFILIAMRGTLGAAEIVAYGFICFAPMVTKIYKIQVALPNAQALAPTTVTTETKTTVSPPPATEPPPPRPGGE